MIEPLLIEHPGHRRRTLTKLRKNEVFVHDLRFRFVDLQPLPVSPETVGNRFRPEETALHPLLPAFPESLDDLLPVFLGARLADLPDQHVSSPQSWSSRPSVFRSSGDTALCLVLVGSGD